MIQSNATGAGGAPGTARERLYAACVPALLFLLFATLPFNRIIALRRVVLFATVVAALVALVRAPGGWRARCPRLPAAVWLWFAVPVATLAWSVRPRFTAGELIPDVLYPLATMLAAMILVDRRARLTAALAGLAAGTFAVCIAGIALSARVATYDWYELAHGVGKFSTFAVMVLPLVHLWAAEGLRKGDRRAFAAAAVLYALLLVAGYTTANRVFWIAAVAAIAVTALASGAHAGYRSVRLRRVQLGVAGSIGLAGLAILAFSTKPANVVGHSNETGLVATLTQSERYEMWRFWLERIGEHPWLGVGFGYDLPMLHYRPLKPAHWSDLMFAHAHNVFIDVTVQSGLIGLAVFCAMLVALAARYLAAARSPERLVALAGTAGLALLAGMIVKNLTDDFFTRAPLAAFWLLNGLALAAIRLAPAERR